MCSISGITWQDVDLVESMNKSNHNRGPDGEGIESSDNWTLGHTLLAINSDSAAQPVRGQGVLSFNGQIYDCPWQEELDTTWLLKKLDASYDPMCLEDTNGNWAFAYIRDDILYLVRDHFGAKPIYYAEVGKGLIFSSTIPALVNTGLVDTTLCNDNIELMELGNYWQNGPMTPYKNIYKIPPGGVYSYCLRTHTWLKKKNLWQNFRLAEEQEFNHFEYRSLAIKAVQQTCNTRKPLGLLHSGGLDSNFLAGVLSLSDIKYTSYTLAYGQNDDLDENPAKELMSEVYWARQTCNFYNTEHKVFKFPAKQDIVDKYATKTLETTLNVLEDNYRMIPRYFLLEQIAKEGGKVVITGEGGDEIFTGYQLHRVWLEDGFPTPGEVGGRIDELGMDDWFPTECFKNSDAASVLLFINLLTQCETYLLRLDAFCGEHSLEGRTPILYQDLVKYCLRLPLGVKLKWTDPTYKGINKGLLRNVFADVILDEIRNKPQKVGWSLPYWRKDMTKQRKRKVRDREMLKKII